MTRHLGITGGFLVAALGASLIVGCGDDDGAGDPDPQGGSGGKAGSGTGGSKAGTTTGGSKAGSDGGGSDTGGSATAGTSGSSAGGDTGGLGGEGGTDPVGGGAGDTSVAGQGGEGGEPPTFATVSKLKDTVYTKANDFRGLRWSSTGKLWASGHIGINTNVNNAGSPAGEPDKKLVIARFNADGTPDNTFDTDGFLEVNLVTRVEAAAVVTNDGNEESLGLVELANGDIVVSVNLRDVNGKGMDTALARFTSAGAPVTTFGDNGVARLVLGWAPADDASFPAAGTLVAPSDSSWGVELDKHGNQERLVVFTGGTAAKGQLAAGVQRTDNDRYITRVLATTGAIDPEFNAGKPFSYNTGGTFGDNTRRGLIEADGSILAAGYTNFGAGLGNYIVAIRLKPDGTRDLTFGFGIVDKGVARLNPFVDDGGVAECYNIVRQSTGRLITTGYGSATATGAQSSYGYLSTLAADLVSVALTPDGKGIDEDWGNLGTFVGQSEELAAQARYEERGRDMTVLADDRLVYAGNFATDPALYVVTPTGDFDPTNNVGQLFRYTPLTVAANGGTSHFYRVVVSNDGKRIAASTNQNIDGAMLAVLKVGE